MMDKKKRYYVVWTEWPSGVKHYTGAERGSGMHFESRIIAEAHKFTYKQARKIVDDCNRDAKLAGWLPKYEIVEAIPGAYGLELLQRLAKGG
jgi:hypothetical protein